MNKHRLYLLLTALMFGALLAAKPVSADQTDQVDVAKECQRVRNVQPPKTDIPSVQEAAKLVKCNAMGLYDTTKGNPHPSQTDWDKTRHCAFATKNIEVLLMLYANGYGVKFNRNLAIKYACEPIDPDYDIFNQKAQIEYLTQAHSGRSNFELCDFGSGFGSSLLACAERDRAQQRKSFRHRYAILEAHFTLEQKAAFSRLRMAFSNLSLFRDFHPAWNLVGDSTGAMGMSLSEELRQESALLEMLEQCEQGKFPEYQPESYAQNEHLLQDVHNKIMQIKTATPQSDLDRDIIALKKKEKNWLKFRDALVTFGKLRYPNVLVETWKATLTEQRMDEIRQMESDLDSIRELQGKEKEQQVDENQVPAPHP